MIENKLGSHPAKCWPWRKHLVPLGSEFALLDSKTAFMSGSGSQRNLNGSQQIHVWILEALKAYWLKSQHSDLMPAMELCL